MQACGALCEIRSELETQYKAALKTVTTDPMRASAAAPPTYARKLYRWRRSRSPSLKESIVHGSRNVTKKQWRMGRYELRIRINQFSDVLRAE